MDKRLTVLPHPIAEANHQTMLLGFQKLESEVIKLRDNLVGIVDASVNSMNERFDMKKLEEKFDKLEKIALENLRTSRTLLTLTTS